MPNTTPQPAPSALQITKERVKAWSACQDGYRWFLEHFPQGADYGQVQAALRADRRFDDVRWLAERMFAEAMAEPAIVGGITSDAAAEAAAIIAVAGRDTLVRAGDGGAVGVAYHDGMRTRFAVGYVGEGLKPLTWYRVSERGEFVEVEGEA